MHISGGDWPDQSPAIAFANRKCDEEGTFRAISTDRDETIFVGGMDQVGRHERLAPKDCLYFRNRHPMALALRRVSRVPVKSVESEVHQSAPFNSAAPSAMSKALMAASSITMPA
jgi:hypothetical protein